MTRPDPPDLVALVREYQQALRPYMRYPVRGDSPEFARLQRAAAALLRYKLPAEVEVYAVLS